MTSLKYLIEQYTKATGEHLFDPVSEEFFNWVDERYQMGVMYSNLLDWLDLDFKSSSCAELNKSVLDSCVLPYETAMLTPYTTNLESEHSNFTKCSDFYVNNDGEPIVKCGGCFENSYFKCYMTQNFNKEYDLRNWDKLHNTRRIIVGIYGNKYDLDREEKIKTLKSLKDKIFDDYIYEFDTENDNYYFVIASDHKKLQKRKYR